MIQPDYRPAEIADSAVWGLFGALLLVSGLSPAFDPVPALAPADPPLLIGGGAALIMSAGLSIATAAPWIRYETTRWALQIAEDTLLVLGLCAVSYTALSWHPSAVGWGVIGAGFAIGASVRLALLGNFLRRVRHERRAARGQQ